MADRMVRSARFGLGKRGAQVHKQNKELVTMVDKTDRTGKTKSKRLSKSERTHQRRLKQAARRPGGAGS